MTFSNYYDKVIKQGIKDAKGGIEMATNLSYKKRLWDVLKKYGLYEPSLSNWCNYINKYI